MTLTKITARWRNSSVLSLKGVRVQSQDVLHLIFFLMKIEVMNHEIETCRDDRSLRAYHKRAKISQKLMLVIARGKNKII